MDNKKFGEFIQSLRKEKGLTQKELADKLYLTSSSISKWERGLSFPDISILEPLSEVLEVSISELIKGERINNSQEQDEMVLKTLEISKEEIRKTKKKNKKIIVVLIIIFILVLFFIYSINLISTPEYELLYTQEYIPNTSNIKGNVNVDYFTSRSPDFAIGANSEGYAVFKDPDKAFKRLKKDYKQGIKLIQKEYCKTSLTKRNFICYANLGWQVTTGTKEEQEQAQFVSSFFDIYLDSFTEDTQVKLMGY